MRFHIKKLLEGFDPADLMEQSMYCFGSDSGSDGGDQTTTIQAVMSNKRLMKEAVILHKIIVAVQTMVDMQVLKHKLIIPQGKLL